MRRKEERSKQGQTNNKAKQHVQYTQGSHFSKNIYMCIQYYLQMSTCVPSPMPDSDVVSLWDIDGNLEIKVDSAGNLNVGKDTTVSLGTHTNTLLRKFIECVNIIWFRHTHSLFTLCTCIYM